ncbi:glycine cleavage system aminomethyltransferase GcvT [Phytohalomonas tamaricis]|uniref:glycine cleavage system aminomethyltransferase GcvT n=1 Tax=Phytohalomonas tamaricis TaxID=2081032 RepID=UPI000D0B2380|nr:glycine cleavage system aminomethyltransferase GcvT [Phytohalomonas tamaricis]
MSDLYHTPLHALHEECGAKFVPFAGYAMPVQFPLGVKREHEHTRQRCGLFDVSHMGQILIRGENPALMLEQLVTADIVGLKPGAQRYALFTSNDGGIHDDLMVVNGGDHLYLVVNAACKDADIALLRSGIGTAVDIDVLDDRALLALQGPEAHRVMEALCPEASQLTFMQHRRVNVEDMELWVSRSGYTGEDGFEISVPAHQAERLARLLLEDKDVEPIGLGARDSLRLEAGLCLYGHDIAKDTTPVEAGLGWAIGKARRQGEEREGGFPGADVILTQLSNQDQLRQRVGLIGEGRAPIREGALLYSESGHEIGVVTSGTFGPSVGQPVAMGYVDREYVSLGTVLHAEVRGKRLPLTVSKMPFITPHYYRG